MNELGHIKCVKFKTKFFTVYKLEFGNKYFSINKTIFISADINNLLEFDFLRNEDSFCLHCWSGVLAVTRGWRRALFYLPLSCILAWRPHRLWLSYVAGEQCSLLKRSVVLFSWALAAYIRSQLACWRCCLCCILHGVHWDDEILANRVPASTRSAKASWTPSRRITIASRRSWWVLLKSLC